MEEEAHQKKGVAVVEVEQLMLRAAAETEQSGQTVLAEELLEDRFHSGYSKLHRSRNAA